MNRQPRTSQKLIQAAIVASFACATTAHAQIPFFTGATANSNGSYSLTFTDGSLFGTYTIAPSSSTPGQGQLNHVDMGSEWYEADSSTTGGVYLYDSDSASWLWTTSALFPYIAVVSGPLNGHWLWYWPDYSKPNPPGDYTSTPRVFADLTAGQTIMICQSVSSSQPNCPAIGDPIVSQSPATTLSASATSAAVNSQVTLSFSYTEPAPNTSDDIYEGQVNFADSSGNNHCVVTWQRTTNTTPTATISLDGTPNSLSDGFCTIASEAVAYTGPLTTPGGTVTVTLVLSVQTPGAYTIQSSITDMQALTGSVTNLGALTVTEPFSVTTSPTGLPLTVDGANCTSPCNFQWAPTTTHTIATSSPTAAGTGTQYVFSGWSDAGALSHTITAPSSPGTYLASFATQYYLTTAAGTGGTISPAAGWYNSGASVPVSATATGSNAFTGFTGALTGATTPQNLSMNAPESVTAGFSPIEAITVTTSLSTAEPLTVDGSSCTSPCNFQWIAGTTHTIASSSTIAGGTGTQYVFSGWSDGGAQSHTVTVPNSTATYTATLNTQYQLTISAGTGGTETPSTGSFYAAGATVPIAATPNSGYTFNTWTGSVANASSASTSVTLSSPQTVAASFLQMTGVTIQTVPSGLQFTVDGGAAQTAPQTLTLSQGQHTIAVATTQTPSGGTQDLLISWSDGGAASHTITVGASAATYTATFQTQYQLNISASPSTGGSVSPATGTFYNAGTVVPIAATANSQEILTSWTGSAANPSSASTTVTMSSPQTVTANFGALTAVTIQTTPAGLQFSIDGGTPQTAPQTLYLSQTSHTLAVASTQAPSGGTQDIFTSWNDNGAASHTISVGTSPLTFTATFQTQYQLTISAGTGGTVTPASGAFYNANAFAAITATANSGYAFTSWTGSVIAPTSASTSVIMATPLTVSANFAPLTAITVQTSPTGLQFSVDGGTAQTAPQTLNLTQTSHTIAVATTQAGTSGTQYVFASWSNGGPASDPITVGTTTATYTANFGTQYYLTTAASPSADGAVSPASGWYASGTSVPVSATPNGGYLFTGFTGALSGATTPQSVTMNAPESVTAGFGPLPTTTVGANPAAGQSLTVDGSACTSPCAFQWTPTTSHTIASNSPVTGNTGAGTQYLFSTWSDGGAQSHTITAPSSSATFTANFQTQYYLTTTANPSTEGTVSPASGWYNIGTSVPVSAAPNSGYSFTGFTGALSGSTTPQSVTMNAPESVTAGFGATPAITNISPTSAAPGTPITITGSNFGPSQGSSTLTIGGVSVTPTTWNGTITALVPPAAANGTVVVTVNGVPGTGAFALLPADFTITLAPNSSPATAMVGGSATYTVTITPAPNSGFNSPVTLTAAGLPAGASACFSSSCVNPYVGGPGNVTMTVTAPSNGTGNFTVTVNGSTGFLSHNAVSTLAVQDFTVTLSPSNLNNPPAIAVGGSQVFTISAAGINGFTGNITLNYVAGSPACTLSNITPPPPVAAGAAVTMTLDTSNYSLPGECLFQVSATAGVTHTLSGALDLISSQNFSLTLPQGQGTLTATPATQAVPVTFTPTVASVNNFCNNVSFQVTGLPAGVSYGAPPVNVCGNTPAQAQITISVPPGTPQGNYQLSIDAYGLPSGSYQDVNQYLSPFLQVGSGGSAFSISASPPQTTAPGGTAQYTITVNGSSNSLGNVTLTATGGPPGATVLLNGTGSATVGVGSSATMTVSTLSNAGLGTYPVTITGMLGTIPRYATALTNIAQAAPASIISPTPGTLPSGQSTFTFTWNSGIGATQYQLAVGSSPSSANCSSASAAQTANVTIYSSSSPAYITLSSVTPVGCLAQSYVYFPAGSANAVTQVGTITVQPNGPPVTVVSPVPNDTITGCSAPPGITAVVLGGAGSQTVTFTPSASAQAGTAACSTALSNTVQMPMIVGDADGINSITATQTGPGMYHLSISGYGFGDDNGGGGNVSVEGAMSVSISDWQPDDIEVDIVVPDDVCGTYPIEIDPEDLDDDPDDPFGPEPLYGSVELCPDVPNAPTVTVDSLQAVQPASPNAIDGTAPPVTPVTTVNANSAFALESSPPQDLVVILKNSGTVTVNAINTQPAASASSIQWELDRDPTDTVDTALPSLTSTSGSQTTFQPSTAGNFRLIAYVTPSGNGPFVEGEQLRVLRFAIVQATLQTGSTFQLNNTLIGSGLNSAVTDPSGIASNAPMFITAKYLLQGGGKTQTLGTKAVTIGDIGNLTADTFSINYPGTPASTGTDVVQYPRSVGTVLPATVLPWASVTPMVDTLRVQPNTSTSGGITPYRSTLVPTALTPPTSGGTLTQYISADAPIFGWNFFTNGQLWGTTTGSLSFTESMVAYSASFSQTYLSLHQANWTISVVGSNSNMQGWKNTGSSITGSQSLQPAATPVQVRGLSAARQVTKIYTTGNQ